MDNENNGIMELVRQLKRLDRQIYYALEMQIDDICDRTVSMEMVENAFDTLLSCLDIGPVEHLFKRVCKKYRDIYPDSVSFYMELYQQMQKETE